MSFYPDSRVFATVNVAALQKNYHLLAQCAQTGGGTPRTIAVVKANAYGHGVSLVVPALLGAGCDFFAVATLEEAREVRFLAPLADILILGYTPPSCVRELAELRLIQTVFSAEYAAALSKQAVTERVFIMIHLKIDGGMCRLGFSPEETEEISVAATKPNLKPLGIYTHFPVADRDISATYASFSRFLACRQALAAKGLSLFAHAAASAALLTLPQTVLDGVRVGLALYGISPVGTALPLTPVLSLLAPVIQTHRVSAGTPVGYGGTFVTARPSLIGTLPVGYADGLPRSFGERIGRVRILHKGRVFFAPIAGRICMDQTMVDLTDTPSQVGDLALLFERADEVAPHLGTIPYEILAGIGARVARRKI